MSKEPFSSAICPLNVENILIRLSESCPISLLSSEVTDISAVVTKQSGKSFLFSIGYEFSSIDLYTFLPFIFLVTEEIFSFHSTA